MRSSTSAAGERAAQLTRHLLAFSRGEAVSPELLELNRVTTHMAKILGRLIGEHIEIDLKLGTKLGLVCMDPGHLEQVLLNLAVNARGAMPNGGRLTIETRPVLLDEDFVADHPTVKPGPAVMIAVSDTGEGMDAETRERIFDPLFTTKEEGSGTGLGLSTVYGIVKQSGGAIRCYSELGRGTVIKVYLPRAEAEAETAPLPSIASSPDCRDRTSR